ncbi:hypothetical protein EalM132_00158 [Exiguobacterium phage vB_EalM-132]|nr:hypothetical protein EalM132_00158 [Exiguobacterium phage vB_EalM-132]
MEKYKLCLTLNRNFAGFIGQPTGAFIDEVEVCVGDEVKVGESDHTNPHEGIVFISRANFGVHGSASTPITELNLLEILHSHKDLTDESIYNIGHGSFSVAKFKY